MSQVPEQYQGGGAVADPSQMQWASTGLEDFAVTDAVLPRIKIEHDSGMWVDNLGGVRMETLRFIALGLVKQRVLFHHNVENDDVPMCKSSDFNLGFPNQDAPQAKSFPWELSGFDPANFPPDSEGNVKLPCSGCQLKEWGSNPTNDNPYCSEQWTLPIYYDTSQDGSGEWGPAILTLQKSSIKPIRTYFTQFAQSNKPPFLAIGRATLKVNTRGSVKYSIPTFVKEGESPRERWMEFSEQFTEMRTFLTRPPVRETDGDAGQPQQQAPQNNTYTGPPQQQAPAPAAEPQSAPPAAAQPAQDPWTGQPAQQAPAPQQQTPPPAQPQQAPAQTPPPAQAAPPQQTPPPAAQQPAQTPPPAGQELPF